jgi:hypothetical protein
VQISSKEADICVSNNSPETRAKRVPTMADKLTRIALVSDDKVR